MIKQEGLGAQVGYRCHTYRSGRPVVFATKQLEQNFDIEAPKQVWVVADVVRLAECHN